MRVGPWLAAKYLVIGLGVANLIFGVWFIGQLISERPAHPVGLNVVPFHQHGAVTFVSDAEMWTFRGLFISALFLVVLYNLIEFALRRRRRSAQ